MISDMTRAPSADDGRPIDLNIGRRLGLFATTRAEQLLQFGKFAIVVVVQNNHRTTSGPRRR
jgi:hypothetical protein